MLKYKIPQIVTLTHKNKEGVYPASYIWHHARNPQLYASLVS